MIRSNSCCVDCWAAGSSSSEGGLESTTFLLRFLPILAGVHGGLDVLNLGGLESTEFQVPVGNAPRSEREGSTRRRELSNRLNCPVKTGMYRHICKGCIERQLYSSKVKKRFSPQATYSINATNRVDEIIPSWAASWAESHATKYFDPSFSLPFVLVSNPVKHYPVSMLANDSM